jgi:hypothetical protein
MIVNYDTSRFVGQGYRTYEQHTFNKLHLRNLITWAVLNSYRYTQNKTAPLTRIINNANIRTFILVICKCENGDGFVQLVTDAYIIVINITEWKFDELINKWSFKPII